MFHFPQAPRPASYQVASAESRQSVNKTDQAVRLTAAVSSLLESGYLSSLNHCSYRFRFGERFRDRCREGNKCEGEDEDEVGQSEAHLGMYKKVRIGKLR